MSAINPLYEMACTLNELMPHLTGPRRYLRLARELIAAGVTGEQVREWYGDGGRWRSTWPGSTGRALTQADVSGTVMLYLKQPAAAVARPGGADLMSEFFAAVAARQAGE